MDRNIEAAFAALLNGATPESLHASQDQEPQPEQPTPEPRPEKKHKKNKRSKTVKGDHRIIVDCQTVQDVVFQREKDPEKVYGRRKNRKARFVVEKPEDWRSVDMIDHPNSSPAPPQSVTSLASDDDNNNNNNSNHLADNLVSDSDPDENEGGIVLETSKPPPQTNPTGTLDAATPQDPDSLPDTVEYGYGSGKVRPPQHQNDINGSVGGEKGWAERSQETPDLKAKRREGQRRADEREKVRQAARRGCAFGFAVAGDQEEKKKCEAVMKGTVVEASFAKGEWGVRWRERV